MSKQRVLSTFALISLSTVSLGHHSIAAYDAEGWQEIEGVVAQLSWRNPHMTLVITVRDENGSAQEWNVEGAAVNTLVRRGVTRESLEVGQRIRLGGWPSSRGRTEILATNLQVSTGEEFFLWEVETPPRWTSPQIAADTDIAAAEDIFRVPHRGSVNPSPLGDG